MLHAQTELHQVQQHLGALHFDRRSKERSKKQTVGVAQILHELRRDDTRLARETHAARMQSAHEELAVLATLLKLISATWRI